jgi:hypothetical protein
MRLTGNAMPIPDPKRAALQDQVNSKIKWNAKEDEVLEWLAQHPRDGRSGDD